MQRQVKFIAKVVEPSTVEIVFNGSKVFYGEVSPTEDLESICEWTSDTSLWGKIPMEVKVTQGEIVWSDLYMNYTGVKLVFPGSQNLGYERVRPKNYFSPPGNGELKLEVHINGNQCIVDRSNNEFGSWHYTIKQNEILTCYYYIDRKRVLLFDPID